MALKAAAFGVEPMFNVLFHCFGDNDRVIYHQANGENHTEQR